MDIQDDGAWISTVRPIPNHLEDRKHPIFSAVRGRVKSENPILGTARVGRWGAIALANPHISIVSPP